MAMAQDIATLLTPIGANKATEGGSDADTDPLNALGVPTISPNVDGARYFWFHHSSGDTVDKLDPREMAENVAFLAVMAFVAADMPGYIPRSALRPGR